MGVPLLLARRHGDMERGGVMADLIDRAALVTWLEEKRERLRSAMDEDDSHDIQLMNGYAALLISTTLRFVRSLPSASPEGEVGIEWCQLADAIEESPDVGEEE